MVVRVLLLCMLAGCEGAKVNHSCIHDEADL